MQVQRRQPIQLCVSLGLFLAGVLAGSTASGELKVSGDGDKKTIVREQFDAAQQKNFDIFVARCGKCHSLSRPINALQTGKTPISSSPFDPPGIKKYVVKMMRKPNSGIAREDAKAIISFLTAARKMAETK